MGFASIAHPTVLGKHTVRSDEFDNADKFLMFFGHIQGFLKDRKQAVLDDIEFEEQVV